MCFNAVSDADITMSNCMHNTARASFIIVYLDFKCRRLSAKQQEDIIILLHSMSWHLIIAYTNNAAVWDFMLNLNSNHVEREL